MGTTRRHFIQDDRQCIKAPARSNTRHSKRANPLRGETVSASLSNLVRMVSRNDCHQLGIPRKNSIH